MIANQWKKYSKFNKLEKNLKRIQLGYILSKFTFPSKVKSDLRVNTNITINVI